MYTKTPYLNPEQIWHPKHPKKYQASQEIMTCKEISESTIHLNSKSHRNLRINNSLKHNITSSKITIKPNVYTPITQKAVVRHKISPRCMVMKSPEVVSTGETDQNACSSVELKSGQMKAPHRNGIVISGYNSLQCAIHYWSDRDSLYTH